VCEDCWNDKNFWKRPLYRRDPVEEIASSNPHLLVNISASPYAFGKRAFRCRMLQAIAKHYRVPVAFVNMVGGNDSLVFDGSTLVAVIAAHALGPKNVIGVSMPGPFSSEGSLRDARQLAENLELIYEVVPITEKYHEFRKALAPIFCGLAEDVTEENLQARIR